MFEIFLTNEFIEKYKKLPKSIKLKAEKQEKIFRQNPFHPSLHTEKLEPRNKALWSFRVDKNYRIIFRFLDKNKVVFLTIGSHDWIYKRIKS